MSNSSFLINYSRVIIKIKIPATRIATCFTKQQAKEIEGCPVKKKNLSSKRLIDLASMSF